MVPQGPAVKAIPEWQSGKVAKWRNRVAGAATPDHRIARAFTCGREIPSLVAVAYAISLTSCDSNPTTGGS
jgi:hypothetical protein